MKLYEVPRNTFVRLLEDSMAPVAAEPGKKDDVYLFCNTDGMYSVCYHADDLYKEHIVHLEVTTEVEIVKFPGDEE